MKKGAKQVAKESNRNPRYETEGYKRSEQRKKLTRRINSLRNEISQGKIKGAANIANANALIKELETAKAGSYIDRSSGKYSQPIERFKNAIEYASRRRESIEMDVTTYSRAESKKDLMVRREYETDAKTIERKNQIFQRELNQAGAASDVSVSRISKPEMKIFYAATMDMWKGSADTKNRNHIIMEKLGVKSLEDAFDIIMSSEEAQKALDAAKNELEPSTETSPDYIDLLFALLDR